MSPHRIPDLGALVLRRLEIAIVHDELSVEHHAALAAMELAGRLHSDVTSASKKRDEYNRYTESGNKIR